MLRANVTMWTMCLFLLFLSVVVAGSHKTSPNERGYVKKVQQPLDGGAMIWPPDREKKKIKME